MTVTPTGKTSEMVMAGLPTENADNLARARSILMDGLGGMEYEHAEAAIQKLIKEGLLISGNPGASTIKLPQDSDHPVTLEELIFIAIGRASMCWLPNTGDAAFDSTEASAIGNELIRSLRARGAR